MSHRFGGNRPGASIPRFLLSFGMLAVMSTAPSSAGSNSISPPTVWAGAPDWVTEHWEEMVGTWVTSNAKYRNLDQGLDEYGMQWRWGVGQRSLVGRLYGIREDKEVGDFWEFREYWHPGEQKLIAVQYGVDGTFGTGSHERKPDGSLETLQKFHNGTTGEASSLGHRSLLSGDEQTTDSFDVDEAGKWIPKRSYVWFRRS